MPHVKKERVSYRNALVDDKTNFAASQAFKNIRTSLLYNAADSCPVYAVTSSQAGELKSTGLSNIAVSFAELDKKILLIDADMRSPSIHKIFKLTNRFGLSEIIAGIDGERDSYINKTEYKNLDIITSGKIPPNPAELLSHENFRKFMSVMKKNYDFIFIDLPPVGVVADPLVITDVVAGYIFVVRAEYDDKKSVKDSVARMKQADAKIVGFVLTDVKNEEKSYGGYKNYGSYAEVKNSTDEGED